MKYGAVVVASVVSSFCTVAILATFRFVLFQGIPGVVEARAFHVVGKSGTVLVKIEDTVGLNTGLAGTVTTLNGNGNKLLRLTASKNGEGAFTMWNGKRQVLVEMGADTDGEGGVRIMNGKGQVLVLLGATKEGNGAVRTMNGKGNDLVRLWVTEGGEGAVTTLNGKAKSLCILRRMTSAMAWSEQ